MSPASAALPPEVSRLLPLVVQHIDKALAIVGDTGEILYANPATERLFGYGPGELAGQPAHALGLCALGGEERAEIAEILRQVGCWSGELACRRKDGAPILTQAQITALPSGGRDHWLYVQEDVTARRALERGLQLSELQVRLLVEQSPLSALVYSADGRILQANRAWERTWGLALADMRAFDWRQDAQLQESGILPYVRRAFAGEPCFVPPVAYRPADGLFRGRPIWVEAALYPVEDARGQVRAVVILQRDITERIAAAEALAQEVADLARSNEDLSRFAAIVSHDLQEPLRTLTGHLRIFAEDNAGLEDASLRHAIDAADRMRALIRDLLTLAQVGSAAEPRRWIPCRQPVDLALANLQAAIDEAGAVVEIGDLPDVLAEPAQLALVFQNLIGNAVKFRSDRPLRVRVTAQRRGEEWVVGVADNGIGFDPRYAQRVFEIFQRLHPRERYPGTGIGLAICARIAARHRGRIWAEAEVGEGAVFYLALPAREAAEGLLGATGF